MPNSSSADVMVTDASIPNQPRAACDVSPDNLSHECALRASRPPSFARNVTLEHTFGLEQAISTCILGGRRYAGGGMEARRRSRVKVKWAMLADYFE